MKKKSMKIGQVLLDSNGGRWLVDSIHQHSMGIVGVKSRIMRTVNIYNAEGYGYMKEKRKRKKRLHFKDRKRCYHQGR
ncbi:MAG: hypothetical protein HQM11_07905 [SAR324 cluster bacterium]|nr:hypothetical protein [SAR324 cluster bacterium]